MKNYIYIFIFSVTSLLLKELCMKRKTFALRESLISLLSLFQYWLPGCLSDNSEELAIAKPVDLIEYTASQPLQQ